MHSEDLLQCKDQRRFELNTGNTWGDLRFYENTPKNTEIWIVRIPTHEETQGTEQRNRQHHAKTST